MIEVIYKEEKQEAEKKEGIFSVPRNIRQIGLADGNCKIYMEDYVYTFLGKAAAGGNGEGEQKGSLAVLTGETKWADGVNYIFIKGALEAENAEAALDHIDFTEEIWMKIHEEMEKYFSGQEIVGWFFALPGLAMEATELLKRVHLKHFGGSEKVLMLMDPAEREEAFFRYDNGFLVRQAGFYLYYEKNPMMQAYMVEKKRMDTENPTEKVEDEAVKAFRKIIQKKKGREEEGEGREGGIPVFSYAATACLAIAVIAAGVNFYQNYRKLHSIDTQVETASAAIGDETEEEMEETDEGEDRVTVAHPTVTPLVQPSETPAPLPEEQDQEDASSETAGNNKSTDKNEKQPQEDTEDTEHFYREESDIRKAKRKEALSQEDEEQAAGSSVHASYVIRPGDTLYQISMEKYGNMDAVSEICRLNGLSENEIIYPGQIIVLP